MVYHESCRQNIFKYGWDVFILVFAIYVCELVFLGDKVLEGSKVGICICCSFAIDNSNLTLETQFNKVLQLATMAIEDCEWILE